MKIYDAKATSLTIDGRPLSFTAATQAEGSIAVEDMAKLLEGFAEELKTLGPPIKAIVIDPTMPYNQECAGGYHHKDGSWRISPTDWEEVKETILPAPNLDAPPPMFAPKAFPILSLGEWERPPSIPSSSPLC